MSVRGSEGWDVQQFVSHALHETPSSRESRIVYASVDSAGHAQFWAITSHSPTARMSITFSHADLDLSKLFDAVVRDVNTLSDTESCDALKAKCKAMLDERINSLDRKGRFNLMRFWIKRKTRQAFEKLETALTERKRLLQDPTMTRDPLVRFMTHHATRFNLVEFQDAVRGVPASHTTDRPEAFRSFTLARNAIQESSRVRILGQFEQVKRQPVGKRAEALDTLLLDLHEAIGRRDSYDAALLQGIVEIIFNDPALSSTFLSVVEEAQRGDEMSPGVKSRRALHESCQAIVRLKTQYRELEGHFKSLKVAMDALLLDAEPGSPRAEDLQAYLEKCEEALSNLAKNRMPSRAIQGVDPIWDRFHNMAKEYIEHGMHPENGTMMALLAELGLSMRSQGISPPLPVPPLE